MNWTDFIRTHMAVLAGIDFFTVEVLTWRGLATYYVLFFLQLETRRITLRWHYQTPDGGMDGADRPQGCRCD
jgi:hypothetical protein